MYIFIVNPTAGDGRALRVFKNIQNDPLFHKISCRTFFTKHKAHGEELAKQLVEMYPDKITSFIVVGGDGTYHEVLNGLKSYSTIPLAFIPAGSGNDFARGISSKLKGVRLFKKVVSSSCYRPYWGGVYRTDRRKKHHSRLFANSIGFGFDAEVVRRSNQASYKKWLNKINIGSLSYVVALLECLFRYQPRTLTITQDGVTTTHKNVWMLTICIHGYYGGGMKIIPNSKMNEHNFSVLLLKNISRWKILGLFLTVFWGGHQHFKEISITEAVQVDFSANQPIAYQVDGQSGLCESCHVNKEIKSRSVFQYDK
ncbi:diacylglycerol/lipid kinase family protein [Pontibacillus yanchengensis]|nr:YegS/Rv2252/BmrU family lipid kinase [Pontibacillus yanchengensis]